MNKNHGTSRFSFMISILKILCLKGVCIEDWYFTLYYKYFSAERGCYLGSDGWFEGFFHGLILLHKINREGGRYKYNNKNDDIKD